MDQALGPARVGSHVGDLHIVVEGNQDWQGEDGADDPRETDPTRGHETHRAIKGEEPHDRPSETEEAVEVRDLGKARVEREGERERGDVPALAHRAL